MSTLSAIQIWYISFMICCHSCVPSWGNTNHRVCGPANSHSVETLTWFTTAIIKVPGLESASWCFYHLFCVWFSYSPAPHTHTHTHNARLDAHTHNTHIVLPQHPNNTITTVHHHAAKYNATKHTIRRHDIIPPRYTTIRAALHYTTQYTTPFHTTQLCWQAQYTLHQHTTPHNTTHLYVTQYTAALHKTPHSYALLYAARPTTTPYTGWNATSMLFHFMDSKH